MTRTDALTSGTKLGPYEIQAPLGAGGMGEVYRARDTRLERAVAIKILSAHLCQNAEARDRFDREARAISSLSHPNVCHLYDVGQQDGISYLVMEYLEGETLADRLHNRPLPLEQVLKVGAEICDGLEKAHRSGVVHRGVQGRWTRAALEARREGAVLLVGRRKDDGSVSHRRQLRSGFAPDTVSSTLAPANFGARPGFL